MSDEKKVMNGKPVFTVPAKTIVNFDSRFDKKLLCDGITFTTGSGCVYSCSFCYVPDMQKKQMEWFKKHGVQYPDEGHLGVVIRSANAVDLMWQQIQSKPLEYRAARKVIYASPKVDVAGNMDLVRETVEACKVIFELTNWDIRLLSKSTFLPQIAKMLDAYNGPFFKDSYTLEPRSRIIYGVSTGTLDDKLTASFEQGTPLVSKRIQSLHWLQDNGYRTFGMICPSLPQIIDGYYKDWAAEMALAIRPDRCEHVWAEVINVRGESFDRTIAALRAAGSEYNQLADAVARVSNDKEEWEKYARLTFEAHIPLYRIGQLRFLQYVTKENRSYWAPQQNKGAVLL